MARHTDRGPELVASLREALRDGATGPDMVYCTMCGQVAHETVTKRYRQAHPYGAGVAYETLEDREYVCNNCGQDVEAVDIGKEVLEKLDGPGPYMLDRAQLLWLARAAQSLDTDTLL